MDGFTFAASQNTVNEKGAATTSKDARESIGRFEDIEDVQVVGAASALAST